MAQKYIIQLQAKTDKALDGIEDLKKEIQSLNKQVIESNKKTEDGLKGVEDASKSTAKGLKGIGLAIKAIGIGLVLEAFTKFKEVLGQNQQVTNLFNTAFEALSIAFNDFINFISNNWEKATKPVTDFFGSESGQRVKEFARIITVELITRIKNLIEGIGGLGSALFKVFKGDFKGAGEAASEALDNFGDALMGNAEESIKTAEVIDNLAQKVSNYVKQTVSAAQANVELARTAEINAAINQGLIEQYDRQAEQQRQIRDDDRNTIEERIEANQKLAEILNEQQKVLEENAQAAVASAQAQFDKLKNDENEIALIQAKNELKAIEARIEGQRSEQLSNANALQREQLELTQSQIDGEAQRAIDKAKFDAEFIQGEVARLEALKQVAIQEAQIEEKRLADKKNLYKEGTQAFIDAENELLDFQQANAQNQKKIDRDITESKLNTVSQSLGQIANLVGENSKFGKAIAVSQAIIDTYVGANKALAQGGVFGGIAAAGVIASGLANVKTIISTKDPAPPSFASGGGGGTSVPSPPPAPPAFNIVGASQGNQLADAIAGQQQRPVKAFVVSREVTSAQELDRNAVRDASI